MLCSLNARKKIPTLQKESTDKKPPKRGIVRTATMINLKDVSPTFEYIAMVELAETLARQELELTNGANSNDIEYLIELCPMIHPPQSNTVVANGIAGNGAARSKIPVDDIESDDLLTDYADSPQESNSRGHILLVCTITRMACII